MQVGILGTGAVARKHAQAYRKIGYSVTACSGLDPERGRRFALEYGCEAVANWRELCRHVPVDFVDVCMFPDFRLGPVEECAAAGKAVLVEKPIATDLGTARKMIETARAAGVVLGVISQRRFDEANQFLKRAIAGGRLGQILQADAYVKWYRSPEYYARPGKGAWAVEGGGALLTQAIHQVDLLLWLAGPVRQVFGEWQLGAFHRMESEDVVSAVMRYASGATGVLQAATAFHPGLPERLEIHGTRGTAIVTGDKLTTWQVAEDSGEPPPMAGAPASGASNPMSISLASFERQFLDFGKAVQTGDAPLVSGEEGYRALELVEAIYRSCRQGRRLTLVR